MQLQNQEDIDRFLTRFYGLSDSVVRSISLRYLDDGSRDLEISVSTRDSTTEENRGWVCVEVLMRGVLEMAIRERDGTTNQVLSDGIHLQQLDEYLGLEFGNAVAPLKSVADFRTSDAYAIGSEVFFEVRAY